MAVSVAEGGEGATGCPVVGGVASGLIVVVEAAVGGGAVATGFAVVCGDGDWVTFRTTSAVMPSAIRVVVAAMMAMSRLRESRRGGCAIMYGAPIMPGG